MQEKSVPDGRSAAQNGNRHRPSTAPLVANEQNCRDVANLLLLEEPQAAEDAFLGEPLEAMLHVVRWCLANSEHPNYCPEQMIRGWAKARGRGTWSDRPSRGEQIVWGQREPDVDLSDMDGARENEKLARYLIRYWSANPQAFVRVLDEVEAAATGENGARR